jgi:hypothetical protein
LIWALAAIAIITVAIVVYAYMPPTSRWFPQCPVKLLTGLSCPGCGVQRAFHALLNGNVGEALSYNYFFILSIPYLLLVCVSLALKKFSLWPAATNFIEGKTLAWIYVACFLLWFVVRNILNI